MRNKFIEALADYLRKPITEARIKVAIKAVELVTCDFFDGNYEDGIYMLEGK